MTSHGSSQPLPDLDVHTESVFRWGSFGQTDAASEAYGLEVDYPDYPDDERSYGGVTDFSVVLATPEEVGVPDLARGLNSSVVRIGGDVAPKMVMAFPITRQRYIDTLSSSPSSSKEVQVEHLQHLRHALRPQSEALSEEELLDDLYTERIVDVVKDLVQEAGRDALLASLHAQRQEEVQKVGRYQRLGTLACAGAIGTSELFVPLPNVALAAIGGITAASSYGAYRMIRAMMQERSLRIRPDDRKIAQQVANDVAESIQASFSPDWYINRQAEELLNRAYLTDTSD